MAAPRSPRSGTGKACTPPVYAIFVCRSRTAWPYAYGACFLAANCRLATRCRAGRFCAPSLFLPPKFSSYLVRKLSVCASVFLPAHHNGSLCSFCVWFRPCGLALTVVVP
ncbi:hypothetical protein V6N11_018826 [Hibiscus sabdariffa]|uniref:Uncharacterized protein n=2 Tax=Hibiscus sabdariffa TaxID=183260 RepID=A0ABR2AD69_9ROSI